jgi:hypothetical protein
MEDMLQEFSSAKGGHFKKTHIMLVIVTRRMRGSSPGALLGVWLYELLSQQVRSSNPNWSPLSAGCARTVSYPCG